ncbi:MAG TPA: flagellar biosynthesis protein FlaG [Peptococcaceae bacterium]|nr:MAG: Flagellin [Clostridia bacterium 41_269]HBT20182.1 flagellar biosynthesis protein FlaG [Peptococcaceae bacterium]
MSVQEIQGTTGVSQVSPLKETLRERVQLEKTTAPIDDTVQKAEGSAVEEEQQFSGAVSEAEVIKAIERANEAFRVVNTRFEFSIHEGTKEIMVKIIDEETNEVIREIPPEKILDLIAKIWELAGILVDERA